MRNTNKKKPHQNLIAWQKAMNLVVEIYRVTDGFPKHEIYGLTAQMRRAAVSAPSNMAEGASGRTKDYYKNCLAISLGSLNELSTQLEIARRVGYLSDESTMKLENLLDECMALTHGLKKSLT